MRISQSLILLDSTAAEIDEVTAAAVAGTWAATLFIAKSAMITGTTERKELKFIVLQRDLIGLIAPDPVASQKSRFAKNLTVQAMPRLRPAVCARPAFPRAVRRAL